MEKKKFITFPFIVLLIAVLISGCGIIYTDIITPMPTLNLQANADSQTKVGKASCTSYVWVVGTGDCSTAAAMKNGGISKIHHVDWEVKSILLGFYRKYTTVVYGE